MDILYHGIVGFAIAKTLGGKYETAAAVSAIAPDIIAITPYFIFKLMEIPKIPKNRLVHELLLRDRFINTFDRLSYRITHSFVGAALFTGAAYLIYTPAYLVVGLAYLSHILIDIPTHDGDFTTYILFPFSTFHFKGKDWTKNKNRYFTFWEGLTLLAVLGKIFQFV